VSEDVDGGILGLVLPTPVQVWIQHLSQEKVDELGIKERHEL